jgi:TetR/AcrR family transcriptional regulator, lmrAB and yxaGH operons repressor
MTDTRARMVRTAASLFRRQGYAATSWRQVVAVSETPWGSQAHHFPGGKEQLAAEAIEHAGAGYERLLRSALADAHPADAVAAWAELAASELASSGWADGCPVATVALETAQSSELLAEVCAAAFDGWRSALVDAFTDRGVDADEANSIATLVLASMEGALLLARAHRSAAPLSAVASELARLIRERVP